MSLKIMAGLLRGHRLSLQNAFEDGGIPSVLLHTLALDYATRILERARAGGREPDFRSWQVLELMRSWLEGEVEEADRARAQNLAKYIETHDEEILAWSVSEPDARYAVRSVMRYTERHEDWLAERLWQRERLAWLCEQLFEQRLKLVRLFYMRDESLQQRVESERKRLEEQLFMEG